jgi:ribosomal protein S18 acetylase RimI-like enzyme
LPNKSIEFRKMTETEFTQYYSEESLEAYAQSIARNFARPIEETRTEARAQVKNLLPEGVHTKGHHMFVVVDTETGSEVGTVWVHVDDDKKRAFLYDITVNERYRGMAYGRAIMQALESTVKQMKATSIGLHVFAENQVAINLYKKQGYRTASLNMHKELS